MKDWTGNTKSIFTTLGASSHVSEERQKTRLLRNRTERNRGSIRG